MSVTRFDLVAKFMRTNDLHLELSRQIIELCRRDGYPSGKRLTERGLAKVLGVSRSPVRGALKYLASKHVVAAQPGGGYALKRSGAQLEKHIGQVPKATAETVYLQFLKDRFAGDLPDQISEADLMRRYNVPRGVLLKVLHRLSQEGFAHRGQGHGWVFHEVLNNVGRYRQSYEVRLAIEPAAIRSDNFRPAIDRFTRLRELHEAFLSANNKRGKSGIELFDLDAELHETIAASSNNPFFVEIVRHQNQLRRIVEYESFAVNERTDESCEEHINILDALLRDDREWAATLMTRHLELARDATVVFPAQNSASNA